MEVFVVGEIDGAEGFGARSLFCRWQVLHGDGWSVLEGLTEGQTQVDDPLQGPAALWCHPLDVHYRTTTLAGWPRLRVQVWHHDEFGRNEICGYGFCHLPTSPGLHRVEAMCWRPRGTFFEELSAFFLGGAPRLLSDSIVTSAQDRLLLNTVPTGTVRATLGVILKDHARHGLQT
eukprot:m51a1_g329 putative b9 domain-containing protein 2-like (175) ;mRNA; r:466319-466965